MNILKFSDGKSLFNLSQVSKEVRQLCLIENEKYKEKYLSSYYPLNNQYLHEFMGILEGEDFLYEYVDEEDDDEEVEEDFYEVELVAFTITLHPIRLFSIRFHPSVSLSRMIQCKVKFFSISICKSGNYDKDYYKKQRYEHFFRTIKCG